MGQAWWRQTSLKTWRFLGKRKKNRANSKIRGLRSMKNNESSLQPVSNKYISDEDVDTPQGSEWLSRPLTF